MTGVNLHALPVMVFYKVKLGDGILHALAVIVQLTLVPEMEYKLQDITNVKALAVPPLQQMKNLLAHQSEDVTRQELHILKISSIPITHVDSMMTPLNVIPLARDAQPQRNVITDNQELIMIQPDIVSIHQIETRIQIRAT